MRNAPALRAAVLTPPRYAARLGVKPEEVLAWIRAGESRAVDAAERAARPRCVVAEADVAAFEARREAKPPAPPPARREADPVAIEFF